MIGYGNKIMIKHVFKVRVTEQGGPVDNKYRDVEFDNEDDAYNFKLMAEEDGSYWGWYSGIEE